MALKTSSNQSLGLLEALWASSQAFTQDIRDRQAVLDKILKGNAFRAFLENLSAAVTKGQAEDEDGHNDEDRMKRKSPISIAT